MPTSTGEKDLTTLLSTLTTKVRPGQFVLVSLPHEEAIRAQAVLAKETTESKEIKESNKSNEGKDTNAAKPVIQAVIHEEEGTTLILPRDIAESSPYNQYTITINDNKNNNKNNNNGNEGNEDKENNNNNDDEEEGNFIAGWITLQVHSSLEAVGLTAAVSTALAKRGIAANVVAGYFHDHVLVPYGRVEEAQGVLRELRELAEGVRTG